MTGAGDESVIVDHDLPIFLYRAKLREQGEPVWERVEENRRTLTSEQLVKSFEIFFASILSLSSVSKTKYFETVVCR